MPREVSSMCRCGSEQKAYAGHSTNNKHQYSVILLNIVLHQQFKESNKGVLHSLNFLSNSNKALKNTSHADSQSEHV